MVLGEGKRGTRHWQLSRSDLEDTMRGEREEDDAQREEDDAQSETHKDHLLRKLHLNGKLCLDQQH